ncbi:unnamed protein product, partial [Discosporangium mesarthrocarpum]
PCSVVLAREQVLTGAGYTQKADLWSLGVITFALLSGDLPFLKDEADLTNKVRLHLCFSFSFHDKENPHC